MGLTAFLVIESLFEGAAYLAEMLGLCGDFHGTAN